LTIVSTTRPIIWRTLDSRSGEDMRPRKYFCATIFVAVCDQNFGNSTPFCSKTGLSLPGMKASRVSHSISSNGSRPGIVKYRRTPRRRSGAVTMFTNASSAIAGASSVRAADAISSLHRICSQALEKRGVRRVERSPDGADLQGF
jgi:hypothetical protein